MYIRDKGVFIDVQAFCPFPVLVSRLLSMMGTRSFWPGRPSPVDSPFRTILLEVTVEVAVTLEEHCIHKNGIS